MKSTLNSYLFSISINFILNLLHYHTENNCHATLLAAKAGYFLYIFFLKTPDTNNKLQTFSINGPKHFFSGRPSFIMFIWFS